MFIDNETINACEFNLTCARSLEATWSPNLGLFASWAWRSSFTMISKRADITAWIDHIGNFIKTNHTELSKKSQKQVTECNSTSSVTEVCKGNVFWKLYPNLVIRLRQSPFTIEITVQNNLFDNSQFIQSFERQNTINKRRFEQQYKQPQQNQPADISTHCI